MRSSFNPRSAVTNCLHGLCNKPADNKKPRRPCSKAWRWRARQVRSVRRHGQSRSAHFGSFAPEAFRSSSRVGLRRGGFESQVTHPSTLTFTIFFPALNVNSVLSFTATTNSVLSSPSTFTAFCFTLRKPSVTLLASPVRARSLSRRTCTRPSMTLALGATTSSSLTTLFLVYDGHFHPLADSYRQSCRPVSYTHLR